MTPIETIKDIRIAYIQRTGAYGPENFKVMQALKEWAVSKGIFGKNTIYAIAMDEPDTPIAQCRYRACIEVEDESMIDQAVCPGTIPDGQYAVFTTKHTEQDIEAFWQIVFEKIKGEGLEFDQSRPIIERYREPLISQDLCEFLVPII